MVKRKKHRIVEVITRIIDFETERDSDDFS